MIKVLTQPVQLLLRATVFSSYVRYEPKNNAGKPGMLPLELVHNSAIKHPDMHVCLWHTVPIPGNWPLLLNPTLPLAHPILSLSLSLSLSRSLCFNGHFPGEPGLAGVYWSKGWWRWWQLDYSITMSPWTTGAISRAKLQSTTNQYSVFLQAGCPSCRSTNSVKALKGKYHTPWTYLSKTHLGVFQLCLWPLIAPGYLGGGLPCLSSALWLPYPWVLVVANYY